MNYRLKLVLLWTFGFPFMALARMLDGIVYAYEDSKMIGSEIKDTKND